MATEYDMSDPAEAMAKFADDMARAEGDSAKADIARAADAHLRKLAVGETAASPDLARYAELAKLIASADDPMEALRGHYAGPEPPAPIPLPAIDDPMPPPILTCAGESGAVLSAGEVAVLAGEGGLGKSALTLAMAHGVASLRHGRRGKVAGLFDGVGGPVLLVSYEDRLGVTKWRSAGLAEAWSTPADAQGRIHALNLRGWPLFGPPDRGASSGLYNSRPEPLRGWRVLEDAAEAIRPRLMVIDPCGAAYVGDQANLASVREFVGALGDLAERCGAGVLLIAHSTKSARPKAKKGDSAEADPYDPAMVSGSAAWVDATRGVLVMYRRAAGLRLAVAKANYGPSRIDAALHAVGHPDQQGAVVGFDGVGEWMRGRDDWGGDEPDNAGGDYV